MARDDITVTMAEPDQLKAMAIEYGLRHGRRVFPVHSVDGAGRCSCADPACGKPGKHPRIAGWPKLASASAIQINHWWTQWPDANIGMVMAPDLIGIDVDPRNGGDETWLDLCIRHGGFTDTWEAKSGGGGAHYIYRLPEGCTPRTDSLGPGVDIKYHGYLLVAPSRHVSGGAYAWDIEHAPDVLPVAELPATLAAMISRSGPSIAQAMGDAVRDAGKPEMRDAIAGRYAEGTRHQALHRVISWLRNKMDEPEALTFALAWNAGHCDPPQTDAYVREQVAWAYRHYPDPELPATVTLDAPLAEDDGSATTSFQDLNAFIVRRPPRWLVEDYLVSGSYAALVGEPGAGKSLLAIEMALSMANGLSMFGHRVRPGRVLYVVAEGQGGFGRRTLAWLEARLPGEATQPAPPGQFMVLPVPVNLTDPATVRRFIEQVQRHAAGAQLVVFDTLSQNMGGANENDSEAMGAVNAAARAVRTMLSEDASVLLVHHGRKSDGRIRGHSSLEGALDTIIGVEQETKGIVTVRSLKQKDGSELSREHFEITQVDVRFRMHQLGLLTEEPMAEGDIVIPPITASVVLEPQSRRERPIREERPLEELRRPLSPAAATVGRILLSCGVMGGSRESIHALWKQEHRGQFASNAFNRATKVLINRGLMDERAYNKVLWLVPRALERLADAVAAADAAPSMDMHDAEGRP